MRRYDGQRKSLEYAPTRRSGAGPASVRAPIALPCTCPQRPPHTIMAWFLRCWRIEAAFQAVCTHLGGETQHRWSVPAIARTDPALPGLFS
ncbi:MAG: hypothetical protein OXC13_06340 [Caldilineaceae bacterium]|nr:hypothetical protein [Caldilineaceae bacterium]